MSGYSNVGNRAVYEAGDQRNYSNADQPRAERYHEGQPNSHQNLDSKDERTIANRLAAEERRDESPADQETQWHNKDATLPAKMHGNEPSRGAEIDAELQADDERRLREKKGK